MPSLVDHFKTGGMGPTQSPERRGHRLPQRVRLRESPHSWWAEIATVLCFICSNAIPEGPHT